MEIRFCDRCTESIPDADFDSGRAVTINGTHYHIACALTRSLGLSGRRSWLTFVLALYAAGVTTFLLVAALGRAEDPTRVPRAVEVRIEESADEVRQQVRRERDSLLASVQEDDQRRRLQDMKVLRTDLEALQKALQEHRSRIDEMDQLTHANLNGLNAKVQSLEREVGNVFDLVRETIRKVEDEASRRVAAPPAPEPPEPAPEPATPPPEPAPSPSPSPADAPVDAKHEKNLEEWIRRLKDSNENIRFSATLQLGQLNDLRAVPPLVEVLEKDRDYYVRLGAATALGDMKAAGAVSALVEALDDKDTLVRTAANDALQSITQHAIEFLAEMSARDRRRVMKEWREWWQANEAVVRQRLGQ